MPVYLDLIPVTTQAGRDCNTQATLVPQTPVDHFGGVQTVLTKQRAVVMRQGQLATVTWTMVDPQGRPVDLSGCGIVDSDSSSESEEATTIVLKLVEAVGRCTIQTVTGYSADPTSGAVRAELPAEIFTVPGIYLAEFALANNDADDSIVFSNQFFLVIESGLFGGTLSGPPSLAEVRLHLRDFPEENFLIDTVDFDDAELALMLTRPIQYWNEVPPPIRSYTTQSFPYRYIWLEGCASELCFLAAEHYRRNRLMHSAGGTAVDDKNRELNYQQEGQRRLTEFRKLVAQKKQSLNLSACYGTFGSPYS